MTQTVPHEGMEQYNEGGLTGWRWPDVPPSALPASRRLAPLAFRRRFTQDERAAIEWAAVDRADQSVPERMQAARLRATLKDQEQADFIDLDDPDTATGVQLLEALGLIQNGRAAEVLSAPVQPEEMP